VIPLLNASSWVEHSPMFYRGVRIMLYMLILMLVVLFAFVVIGLIIKKTRERSNRTWPEFILDSSKQMIGASWLHILNIVFSFALHSLGGGDECTWYWLHITLDTTLGVYVNYQLHKLIYKIIIPRWCSPRMAVNFKSGDYGSPGNIHWGKYFRQLFVWLFIVSVMKCTMVLIMVVAHVPLVAIASGILSPFDYNAEFKLIIVMVFTPLLMNTVQFWITDSFTKKKPAAAVVEVNKPNKGETDENGNPLDAPVGLQYEHVPLTEELDDEGELSEFPASPFAVLFNNPEFDGQPPPPDPKASRNTNQVNPAQTASGS
jgi:hypothetical protein